MLRRIEDIAAGGTEDPRLLQLVREFTATVNNREFPCIFSTVPFVDRDLYVDLVPAHARPVESAVVAVLRELCGLIRQDEDTVGVIFVEQEGEPTLAEDFDLASRIVRTCIRANQLDNPGAHLTPPDDATWMLWLNGIGLFINFSSPRHIARRSRNVGSAFCLIAQARASFDRQGRSGQRARNEIRRRLAAYDDVPPHPALGTYGQADSREALQYFLGDGLNCFDVTLAPEDT